MNRNRLQQPRRPKGSPNGTGGQYAPSGSILAGLPDLTLADVESSHRVRRELYTRLDEERNGWLYEDEYLTATKPGPDADYTDEPVCSPGEEAWIVSRMLGSDETVNSLGPVARKFLRYTDSPVQAYTMAQSWVADTLDAARRACALDETKCYSPRMVESLVKPSQVRYERILHDMYGLPAHLGRVGARYQKRLAQWRSEHDGRLTTMDERDELYGLTVDEVKDRIWDDTMHDFIADKLARHVSFGGGMYYSDGSNANPKYRSMPYRRNPDGSRFNGRKDYERHINEFRARLYEQSVERKREEQHWQVASNDDTAASVINPSDREKADPWTLVHLARSQGNDPYQAGRLLGLSRAQVDALLAKDKDA